MFVIVTILLSNRGAYCAIVAASLVNVLSDQLIDKTPEWIARFPMIHNS